MDGLDRVLGLSALVLEALLGIESTAFSGFGLFVSVSFHRGHDALLEACRSLAVAICPRARSVRMMPPLRHVLPGLPAFFYQPYAVYMRPDGFSHSHTVFCMPHWAREGGR